MKSFNLSKIARASSFSFFSIPLESSKLKKSDFSDEKNSISVVYGKPIPVLVSFLSFNIALLMLIFQLLMGQQTKYLYG